MNACLYCKTTLSAENSSREHVLPAALGWDVTISCVCATCNSTFGHDIDAEFIKCFDVYRVKFRVRDREGSTPRPRGRVEGGGLSGKNVRFGVSGPELPRIIKTRERPGSVDFRTYENHDVAELEKTLAARKGIGKLQKLSEGREEFKIVSRHGMEFLSDSRGLRAAVKIVFNFLALKRGSQEALLHPCLDEMRKFIQGTGANGRDYFALPMSPMPPEIPLHGLVLTLDGRTGQIRGMVSLFGFIGLFVRIGDGYTGETCTFATLIDPESREHRDSSLEGVVPDWVPELDALHQRLSAMPQALDAHKIEVFHGAIARVNHYFKELGDTFQIAPAT